MPPHTVTNNQPVGQIVNAMALDFFFFTGDKADAKRFQHCWSSSGFNVASTKTPGRDPKNKCINILQRRTLPIDHCAAFKLF